METNKTKKAKFQELYMLGKYKQKELAKMVGISENTATIWVRGMQPKAYLEIRKKLTKELETLTKLSNYSDNADRISQLITDIERIEKLIDNAKNVTDV